MITKEKINFAYVLQKILQKYSFGLPKKEIPFFGNVLGGKTKRLLTVLSEKISGPFY